MTEPAPLLPNVTTCFLSGDPDQGERYALDAPTWFGLAWQTSDHEWAGLRVDKGASLRVVSLLRARYFENLTRLLDEA